jgi:hypothetical protein
VEFGITGNEHLGFYYATGPHQQHPVTLDSLPPKLPRVVTRCTQQLLKLPRYASQMGKKN